MPRGEEMLRLHMRASRRLFVTAKVFYGID
jgi:hypothetical protein